MDGFLEVPLSQEGSEISWGTANVALQQFLQSGESFQISIWQWNVFPYIFFWLPCVLRHILLTAVKVWYGLSVNFAKPREVVE